MSNRKLALSRRKFVEIVGKSGIATHALKGSSLLAGLLANRYAQANNDVKRVVFIHTPLVSPNDHWLPQNSLVNDATQAFEGWQDVCHFHEIEIVFGGFGTLKKCLGELRWVSDWTGDTIDHQIARALGGVTPFATLHFGVQTNAPPTLAQSISYKNGQHMLPMVDPAEAYNALFGEAGGPLPRHFQQGGVHQNVLDAHKQAIACSTAQLSYDEQQTVARYEAALNALQDKMNRPQPNIAQCYRPAWNQQGFSLAPNAAGGTVNFAEQSALQNEIITHALACGLTQVVTLQLGSEQGEFTIPGKPDFTSMHQATCGSTSLVDYFDYMNFLGGCVTYLIDLLARTDDPAAPGKKNVGQYPGGAVEHAR